MVIKLEKEYNLGGLVKPLCLWYEKNKRSMPWREDASPYHVWLSEIMLQQTRIEAAKSYYERFIKALPDVQALADVSEEELLKLWEGLGYYNRARNLKKTAEILVQKYAGKLPASYDMLVKLPGIGNYTAGAIASIAYGLPAPAVDGNVLRVAMRYLNCRDHIMKQSVRKKMERAVMDVIPEKHPGEFNQALMELGEVVCIPNGKPFCHQCPLSDRCLAHAAGTEQELPVRPEKKQRRIENRTILLLEKEDKIGIVKRPEHGLLGGLWEFPGMEGHKTLTELRVWLEKQGITGCEVKRLKGGKHVFSHVEWHMRGYQLKLNEKQQDIVPELEWVNKTELEKRYAIPVAFHIFLHQID